MDGATLALVRDRKAAKGDVLRVAELAGTMGAKRTADLIPLCHMLPLTSVRVAVEPDESLPGLVVTAEAKTRGRTGVEMEALTAVSVACLTIYDMLKARARGMIIEGIELVEKQGGASGDWRR
jgi:cyclic pyranopterin phosphate synthase